MDASLWRESTLRTSSLLLRLFTKLQLSDDVTLIGQKRGIGREGEMLHARLSEMFARQAY